MRRFNFIALILVSLGLINSISCLASHKKDAIEKEVEYPIGDRRNAPRLPALETARHPTPLDASCELILKKLQVLKTDLPTELSSSASLYHSDIVKEIELLLFKTKVQFIKIANQELKRFKVDEIEETSDAPAWHYDTLWRLNEIDELINIREGSQGLENADEGSMNLATFRIFVRYKSGEARALDFNDSVFLSKGSKQGIEVKLEHINKSGMKPITLEDVSDTKKKKDYQKQIIGIFDLESQITASMREKIIEELFRRTGAALDEGKKLELAADPLILTKANGFSDESNLKMKALLTKAAWALFPSPGDQYYRGKGRNLGIVSPSQGLADLMLVPSMLIYPDQKDRFFESGIGKSIGISHAHKGIKDLVGTTANLLIHQHFTREFYHSEQVIRIAINHKARADYGIDHEVRGIADELEGLSFLTSALNIKEEINMILERVGSYSHNPWESLLPPDEINVEELENIHMDIATHRLICPVCAATYFYDVNHKQQLQDAIMSAIKKAFTNKRVEERVREEYIEEVESLKKELSDTEEDNEAFKKLKERFTTLSRWIQLRKKSFEILEKERILEEKIVKQSEDCKRKFGEQGSAKGQKKPGKKAIEKNQIEVRKLGEKIENQKKIFYLLKAIEEQKIESEEDYLALQKLNKHLIILKKAFDIFEKEVRLSATNEKKLKENKAKLEAPGLEKDKEELTKDSERLVERAKDQDEFFALVTEVEKEKGEPKVDFEDKYDKLDALVNKLQPEFSGTYEPARVIPIDFFISSCRE